jgi:hypothetical protein
MADGPRTILAIQEAGMASQSLPLYRGLPDSPKGWGEPDGHGKRPSMRLCDYVVLSLLLIMISLPLIPSLVIRLWARQRYAEISNPFRELDQKTQIGPRLKWNREVTSTSGETITFRVTSQGPFRVTVVTDKGYKAVQGGSRKTLNQEDVLLTIYSKGSTYEGWVMLPPGSSWFIIENQTDKNVELHLQRLVQ